MRASLFVLALLCATPATAQVFKCIGSDGKTAYQAEPCQPGVRQNAVQTRDSQGMSSSQHSLTMSDVEKVVVRYRACAAYSQDLEELNGAAFKQWRSRHAAAYAAFEADPAAVQRVKDGFDAEKRRQQSFTKAEGSRFYMGCHAELGGLLAVQRRAGPEPDYMKVLVTFYVCHRVAAQDGLDGKFTAWKSRNQEGVGRFSSEHSTTITKSVSDGVSAFEAADAPGKARTRATCRGDLHRWLEEGA